MATQKCSHPACSCQVTADKSYCSEKCASGSAGAGAKCPCNHPGCKGHWSPFTLRRLLCLLAQCTASFWGKWIGCSLLI